MMAVEGKPHSQSTGLKDNPEDELRYGWFGFTPQWMQRFNTAAWWLFWMFMWNNFGSMVNNGLLGVVISSIETRFGLTSTMSSWIVTAYDVAGVPVVVLIGIYGNGVHRPRLTAIGTFMVFLGTVIVFLPQFTTGVYNPTLSQTDDGLCGNRTGVNPYCDQENGEELSLYLIMFIGGRVIAGLGAPFSYTLGITYMDDVTTRGKFGFHTGVFLCGGLLGPAIGYILGGYLLELHTDFYQTDQDSLKIDFSDPRWVGCWWMGFVIGGALVLMIVPPFAAFPRDIPGAEQIRREKTSEVNATKVSRDFENAENGASTLSRQAVLSYSKVLVTNPTFMGMVLYGALDGLLVAGFTAFGPKYLENQFHMDASLASIIFGAVTVPGAGGGSIFGGWLVSRFSLSCVGILRAQFVMTTATAVTALCLLIWCDNMAIAGVTVPYNNSSGTDLFPACIDACFCDEVAFSPVCGEDGIQYYSPCHAGCTNHTGIANLEYANCSCISTGAKADVTGLDGTAGLSLALRTGLQAGAAGFPSDAASLRAAAADGTCPGPQCDLMPLFLAVFFVAMFLLFATGTMIPCVILRCVPSETRNMGVSWSSIVARLLGWLPGPLLFGVVFDNACVLWQDNCGERSSCLYYDNGQIGLHVFLLTAGTKVLGILLLLVAWFFYKSPEHNIESQKPETVPTDRVKDADYTNNGISTRPKKQTVDLGTNGNQKQNGHVPHNTQRMGDLTGVNNAGFTADDSCSYIDQRTILSTQL